MMFAQSLLDFTLGDGVLGIVRIIAAVGGAVVGWFVCDPLTRVIYRLSFRNATPAALLFGVKSAGAVTMSLLIYFFIPLGGGGGGFGFGPGAGGTPGKGQGEGGDKVANEKTKDGKTTTDDKNAKSPQLEMVQVQIIFRKDYKEDEKFYLLKGFDGPITAAELETYFKDNATKIEVVPVLLPDSIGRGKKDNPYDKLLELADKYHIRKVTKK
jgi:hypothetical protein